MAYCIFYVHRLANIKKINKFALTIADSLKLPYFIIERQSKWMRRLTKWGIPCDEAQCILKKTFTNASVPDWRKSGNYANGGQE